MQTKTKDDLLLSLDTIISESQKMTGLTDIGEPDIYLELGVLIDALNSEAKLNDRGIASFQHALTQVLVKRQRIQKTFLTHPEILDEPINGPIFITGLPRSGTTKVQRMLASIPDLQTLPLWKILNPLPITLPGLPGTDHRKEFAAEASRIMKEQFPAFYAGHPMNPLEPDEEEWLLDLAMRGYTNSHTAWVPGFEKFMDQQDFESWYIFLRKLLQLFQWQDQCGPRHWLLKAPSHLRYMKILFKHFPDAVVLHCHRDPVTSIVSLASLMEQAHWMYSDFDHPLDIGAFTLEHWSKQMDGYLDARSELENTFPFFDLPYRDITGNLSQTLQHRLDATPYALSQSAVRHMEQWDRDNPPGKHGTHHYSIERYGLTAEGIKSKFAPYLNRFGHLI